jgi:hypothetical protein
MTHVNRAVTAAFIAAVVLPASAHAQSAGAEALFREGRTLIKQGKIDAGCDKLEASEKIESSVGTLLNLGDCREKQGRFATAWAAFRKAESMAKLAGNDKKRQNEARKRAERLEDSLATITIQVGPKSKADGLVIKRDGETLDPAVYGTAIVVDPGNHTIVAEAPNAKPWKSDVSVGKGGKRWVVVPTLEPVAEAAPLPPPPAADDRRRCTKDRRRREDVERDAWRGRRHCRARCRRDGRRHLLRQSRERSPSAVECDMSGDALR